MNSGQTASSRNRSTRQLLAKMHKWAGLAAAAFWLVQAITGTLLSFHFELDDALRSTRHVPSDLTAIEGRLNTIGRSGPDADVHWIWSTAGLPDRYAISYTDHAGVESKAWIDGSGAILENGPADDYSFLALMREVHIDLLSGNTGQWIMAITGTLLITNLLLGLYVAWPRKGGWLPALKPIRSGGKTARAYSWHRAIGLWAVVPALIIAGTGVMILFEHGIRDIVGAPENELPPEPQRVDRLVGLTQAARAAENAIPGSRFIGGLLPTREDASYNITVLAPGELFRGGYAGSTVIVSANTGQVRAVNDVTKAAPAQAFVASFYPVHTGEAGGTVGRVLAMFVGVWLTTVTLLGLRLWWRRRPRKQGPQSNPSPALGMEGR